MRKLLTVVSLAVLVAACSDTEEDKAAMQPTNQQSINQGVYSRQLSDIVPGSQEDLVTNVGDRVFFGYDSATLDDNSQRTLQRQADWLAANPFVNITIEGHCDERGTREYNLALGERRANAVKQYLTSLGVSPSRVSTISYGKERPVDLGGDDAAWSKNRRGVTVVTNN